eukprot:1898518-Prorocentrum_lima.AAC.1
MAIAAYERHVALPIHVRVLHVQVNEDLRPEERFLAVVAAEVFALRRRLGSSQGRSRWGRRGEGE